MSSSGDPSPPQPQPQPTAKKVDLSMPPSSSRPGNAYNVDDDMVLLRALARSRAITGAMPSGVTGVAAAVGESLADVADAKKLYQRVSTLKRTYKHKVDRSKSGAPLLFGDQRSEEVFKLCRDLWGDLDGVGRAHKVAKGAGQPDRGGKSDEGEKEDDEEAAVAAHAFQTNSSRFHYARRVLEDVARQNPSLSLDTLIQGFNAAEESAAMAMDEKFKQVHRRQLQLRKKEAGIDKELLKKLGAALK